MTTCAQCGHYESDHTDDGCTAVFKTGGLGVEMTDQTCHCPRFIPYEPLP